jgi:hypothetical protein
MVFFPQPARAQAATPTIEAGRIFLPESAPWLAEFLDEHASFPNGAHDDQVDSVTQFINYVRRTGNYTLIDWYKQQQAALDSAVKQPEVNVSACTACGSTFIQNIPGGKRCGQCGQQFSPINVRSAPSRKDVLLGRTTILAGN